MKHFKTELRKLFRSKRRLLTKDERQAYSQEAALILSQKPEFKSAKRVALYMALPEELQTAPIFPLAYEAHKICTVPVLSESNTLLFVTVDGKTDWHANRYGILEPNQPNPQYIDPTSLDVVLVPLVSFDENGTRLGMGAGYYDKTFAFRRHQATPFMIGLAFECQRHHQLPFTAHDISLDAVVTEKTCYRFPRKA